MILRLYCLFCISIIFKIIFEAKQRFNVSMSAQCVMLTRTLSGYFCMYHPTSSDNRGKDQVMLRYWRTQGVTLGRQHVDSKRRKWQSLKFANFANYSCSG